MISNLTLLLAQTRAPTLPNQDPVYNPALNGGLQNLSGVEFFQKLIPALVGVAFVVGAVIFFFILVMGAIQWISSGGDKGAVAAAKSKISNAIIGLIILISVYAIVLFIQNFFGIKILTLDIGSLVI